MSDTNVCPSAAQIAFALTVVRSKPIELSIEEYLDQIQEIIVDKSRKTPVDDEQYLDGTRFWKQAYHKCQAEKIELQNRLFELQQRCDKSAAYRCKRDHHDPDETPKRHGVTDEPESMPIQINRANTTRSRKRRHKEMEDENSVATSSDVELCLSVNDTLPECRSMMRTIHHLTVLIKHTSSAAETLCQAVTMFCHAAVSCVKSAYQISISTTSSRSNNPFKTVCLVIKDAAPSMLAAVERLEGMPITSGNPKCLGDVLCLFKSLLGQIQQLALDETDRQRGKARSLRNNESQVPNCSINDPSGSVTFESKSKCITMSMIQMIRRFGRTSKPMRSRLFEGIMCVLLDCIGSSVSLLVFGDAHTDASSDVCGVLPPRGLVDTQDIDLAQRQRATEIAGPFLSMVLATAISTARKEPRLLPNDLLSQTQTMEAPLIVSLRDRLQETLIRGIFGDDEEAKNTNGHSSNALEHLEQSQHTEKQIDELVKLARLDGDRSTWFVGQVWETLGWDLLADRVCCI